MPGVWAGCGVAHCGRQGPPGGKPHRPVCRTHFTFLRQNVFCEAHVAVDTDLSRGSVAVEA